MQQRKWDPANELNAETEGIGSWRTSEIIAYRIKELTKVRDALVAAAAELEAAVKALLARVERGGRVITIGAGGSGVAGMAVMRELPQNHRAISPAAFTYAVAGGAGIMNPLGCEELEDSWEEGAADIDRLSIGSKDAVILISATGRTPYTRGAAARSRARGAYTIGFVSQPSELEGEVDLPILLAAGPEMFMGATCEKAATAQTVALEAIMDALVVRLGLTDGNRCRARLCHEKAKIREAFLAPQPARAPFVPFPFVP